MDNWNVLRLVGLTRISMTLEELTPTIGHLSGGTILPLTTLLATDLPLLKLTPELSTSRSLHTRKRTPKWRSSWSACMDCQSVKRRTGCCMHDARTDTLAWHSASRNPYLLHMHLPPLLS